MKIIGFTQLRNELSKGNLENWFKQMDVCDYIYIFDQASDDGSLEYYKQFPKATVIESPTNRFGEELLCKDELLTRILADHPDVNWILWLDGDLLLDGRLLANNGHGLRELCKRGDTHKIDAFGFSHYNLWRSDVFYRVDDMYHSLDGNWYPLWRNNGQLKFNREKGLHLKQYPDGFQKVLPCPYAVVHRGFATDQQIMGKYDVYAANGQNGWKLERLLDEHTLTVQPLDRELLPDWFEITDDVNPTTKRKLREIYNEIKSGGIKLRTVEIISLIFKSTDYLDLIYKELKSDKCKAEGWDVSLRIVANDASLDVINKLKKLDIPYTIYNDPKPMDYYLNRVYRCWNFAGKTSKADNIIFVNSDMVFSDGWLSNLLKHHDGRNIPCSRLVESGKLRSGQHAISADFGRTPTTIDYEKWEQKVKELSVNEVHAGGLYMPCVFEKDRFVESRMYPEGNIYHDGVGTLGHFVMSGDAYYFQNVLEKYFNMKHITVYDSLVYHIQEGEKDS